MNIKSLISFSFAAIFSVMQAQMPVKNLLNPFITNSQELKVEKRSIETDLPELIISIRWDEEKDGWLEDEADTTIQVYSNNGWLIERKEIYNFSGKSRYYYTYEGTGRELTRISSRYIEGNWDTTMLNSHTYDEKGLLKQIVSKYDWMREGGGWNDSSRRRFTNKVDQQGRIIERIEEDWTAEDGYEFEEKILYSYGSDGKLFGFESYNWNDSLNAFVIVGRYDSLSWHQYFENDESLEKSKPLYGRASLGVGGETIATFAFSYDMHDNVLEETSYFKDDQGNEIKESSRFEYTYDSKDRCTQRIELEFDQEEGVYRPVYKNIYAKFYTAPNLATENLVVNQVVYPNPAFDHIRLKKKVTELEILNIQGQQLLSLEFLQADEPFDISSLTAGTYILRYRNQQGLIRSSQLLIQ